LNQSSILLLHRFSFPSKQADIQDKVEKTKAEGKGFFAKFFGSKEKSPKKQKVKTPKVARIRSIVV